MEMTLLTSKITGIKHRVLQAAAKSKRSYKTPEAITLFMIQLLGEDDYEVLKEFETLVGEEKALVWLEDLHRAVRTHSMSKTASTGARRTNMNETELNSAKASSTNGVSKLHSKVEKKKAPVMRFDCALCSHSFTAPNPRRAAALKYCAKCRKSAARRAYKQVKQTARTAAKYPVKGAKAVGSGVATGAEAVGSTAKKLGKHIKRLFSRK